jgi:tetratricopeptide (TPR) repeat protein
VLACAVILAAGIVAWSSSFNAPFIFDDLLAIRDNPTLRHFPAWRNFAPPQLSPISRRPVINLTFALNYAIGGLGVRGFHAGNLLIHLLAALLLFGIVRRTLSAGRWSIEGSRDAGETDPPGRRTAETRSIAWSPPSIVGRPSSIVALSLAVALIWAVHPLLTESVTYLTERTESLMGMLYLLTLYCAIRGASSGQAWRWYAAAVAACALGMGAKEVMATAPIVLLLYDRCFLSGSFREALRRRLPFYLGLAATWAILGALIIAYPWGGATGAGFGIAGAGPWQYARTQPGVILHYLRLSFWPSSLCLDYGWPIATSARQIIPAAAVIAALLGGTLWALRRAPALGFLGAWFFLILAPTSSFMPILDAAVERRMYLPLAAIVAACVLAAYGLGGQFVRRAAESARTRERLGSVLAAVALLTVTAALACRTFERNALYCDAISLWRDTVSEQPLNARALNNLGSAYISAGRSDAAVPYLTQAIELAPGYVEAYINRGVAFTRINRAAEALRDLDQAIELNPASAGAYNNRAVVRINTGGYDEALADCDKAIVLLPEYTEAYVNRANALLLTGRIVEALRNYDKAIALMPESAEAYDNRANARLLNNQPAEAIPDCDRAIALRPDFAEAYETRSSAFLRTGRFDLALRDCNNAIALKPAYADAYLNRSSAYGQMKEYDKALADLKTFQQMGGQPPSGYFEALKRAAGRSK